MFELQTTYDLLSSLSQFIYSVRNSPDTPATDSAVITPRIINQEKGGAIIFVWNEQDKEKPSAGVTNFGLYEPDTQKHSLIYSYDKKVKIVTCSLNQERTLLAFSIVKPKESLSEKKRKDVYQAYLAELQSVDKIVYSFNMDRSTFLKVQFLYPDQQAQSQSRDSNMLVFLHKESIGLYKVPMARIGDSGIMMSSQPKTEQIVRKFVWCQWDAQNQRLHYIHNVRVDGAPDNVRQKMSTIQFYGKAKYDHVIDIPINFAFPYIRSSDNIKGYIAVNNEDLVTMKVYDYSKNYTSMFSERPHYGDIPLHPGIPELTLNVTVLTQSSGTFCLCYHKMISETKSASGSQTPQPSSLSDVQDVEYYVSMVHHAKTLYGCISNLPKHVVVQKRLVFTWLGSYLVVMLPGYFIHLLNVGQGFEPCHHILLHDSKVNTKPLLEVNPSRPTSVKFSLDEADYASSTPENSPSVTSSSSMEASLTSSTSALVIPVFSEHCAMMKTLLPCQAFLRDSGHPAQQLYDYRSGCLLKLVINPNAMINSFLKSYWQTRLAILHYLILHSKDIKAIRMIFEVLSENVTNAEINTMFTEFLVASTFAEMKKQVDREVLNLLSFTSIETLRGQYEKSPLGERLAHISYLSLEIVDYNKRKYREQKSRTSEDFWDVLLRRLQFRHQDSAPRFSYVQVMRHYRQAEIEEEAGKSVWDSSHVPDSFFDGVFTIKLTELHPAVRRKVDSEPMSPDASSGRRNKIDAVLGEAPLFLQTRLSPESQVFKRRLSKMTEDHLTNHLTRYLRQESRSKAKNVAKEYLFCQAKVSRQLCHLLWSLRGQRLSHQLESSFLPNLQEPGTDEDYELFQLYERFYLTAGDLGYPLPPGFSSFFTALGFKCLELHLFFQYVDNHVLSLTPDFILQLLEDLDDDSDPEVPYIKFQVISRLPKGFAEQCFERWNHPCIQQKRATEQVTQILLHGHLSRKLERNFGRESVTDNSSFPPLNTFIKHLDAVASSIHTNRPVMYDTHLIKETALYHTRTTTDLDMSTVNF